MPIVSYLVVNFNTRPQLSRCLEALLAVTPPDREIIVVDNASTDGSQDMVRTQFPAANLIALGENHGFPFAVNRGVDSARGDYLFVLNSDVYIQMGAVERLLEVLTTAPDVGLVGPAQFTPGGQPMLTVHEHPGITQEFLDTFALRDVWRYRVFGRRLAEGMAGPVEVDWLSGAALLIKRDTITDVGSFDENVFMYGEEQDFQFRCRKKGWRVYFVPAAKVVHEKSASADRFFNDKRLAAVTQSHYYFFAKNRGVRSLKFLMFLRVMRSVLRLGLSLFLLPVDWSAAVGSSREHFAVIRMTFSRSMRAWLQARLSPAKPRSGSCGQGSTA